MKKILAILLSLLTLLSCGLLSACSAEKTQPDTPDTETVWETVSEAYIYAFPLVLTDATKTLSTNTDGTMTGRAPINQFNHVKKLADASFRTVVTPNVDTVYSQAWLDISTEPMVYVLPETDRFCNVQLLDAWTNTAAVLDKAGAYAIALPGWEGELPDGVTRVDVPTATVWSITRTVLSGNEDLPNVYAIQEQMQLLPLSAYAQGGSYTAPAGTYTKENDFVPVNKVLSMTPAEFFNTANALMQVNPPADADEELLKKLSAINVGAGKTFDAALLGEGAAERWTQMLQGLRRPSRCGRRRTEWRRCLRSRAVRGSRSGGRFRRRTPWRDAEWLHSRFRRAGRGWPCRRKAERPCFSSNEEQRSYRGRRKRQCRLSGRRERFEGSFQTCFEFLVSSCCCLPSNLGPVAMIIRSLSPACRLRTPLCETF